MQKMKVRDRIVKAATKTFLQRGFAQTSTRAIAREAGTSESSLFRYFESKYELLAAVMEGGWRDLSEAVNKGVGPADMPVETLRRVGSSMLRYYRDNPEMGVLLLSESWVMGPASIAENPTVASAFLSQETRNFISMLDRLFEEAQSTGQLSNALSPIAMREGFFGLVEGLSFGWYLSNHTNYNAPYSLEDAEKIVSHFLRTPEIGNAQQSVHNDVRR